MRHHTVTDGNQQRAILIIACISMFMANLDISIVNISLPIISHYFSVGIGTVSRVVLVYFLIMTGCMLGFGRLGDTRGFKRVFIAGFSVFIAGSFLCGMASGITQLIIFRGIQALGASMLAAMAPAIASALLPSTIRGKALGIIGTFAAFGISVGPAVGGLITAHLSWRWIFFINIPLGIIAIMLALTILPKDRPDATDTRFDIVGTVIIFAALMTLLYALNMGQERGWTSLLIVSSFCASFIFFIIFYVREKSITYSLIDFSLFGNRNFSMGTIASLFVLMLLNGTIFLFPFYLEIARGLKIDEAGLILVIPSAVMMFMGPLSGSLSDKTGPKWLCSGGMFLCAFSFILFSLLGIHSSIFFIIVSLALFGLTAGMFMAPNSSLVMGVASQERAGTASSIMMVTRHAGGVLGVCLFETIFSMSLPQTVSLENVSLNHATVSTDMLMAGFHNAFIVGIFLCLAAALFSIGIKNNHP